MNHKIKILKTIILEKLKPQNKKTMLFMMMKLKNKLKNL